MHFQFIVAPPTPALTPPAPPTSDPHAELLGQLLDVQREQLGLMRSTAAAGDVNQARWRKFFERWHEEFPELPDAFRDILPMVERAYLRLMNEMVHHLKEENGNGLEDDFSLGEFLDRYAMRASQIGAILNLLGQMAEAVRVGE